jgi:hypothetical protein
MISRQLVAISPFFSQPPCFHHFPQQLDATVPSLGVWACPLNSYSIPVKYLSFFPDIVLMLSWSLRGADPVPFKPRTSSYLQDTPSVGDSLTLLFMPLNLIRLSLDPTRISLRNLDVIRCIPLLNTFSLKLSSLYELNTTYSADWLQSWRGPQQYTASRITCPLAPACPLSRCHSGSKLSNTEFLSLSWSGIDSISPNHGTSTLPLHKIQNIVQYILNIS